MQPEVLLQLNVIRGLDLPKTELTSKIDAYVKVKAGTFAARTKAKVPGDPHHTHLFPFVTPGALPRLASASGRVEQFLYQPYKYLYCSTVVRLAGLALGQIMHMQKLLPRPARCTRAAP